MKYTPSRIGSQSISIFVFFDVLLMVHANKRYKQVEAVEEQAD